jgi:hypothetical protein
MRYFDRLTATCPAARRAAALGLESLEGRDVPSAAVDLTTPGATGVINGAVFTQAQARPTGTGVIDSFVRIQALGNKATTEQGYNTSARPLAYDENNSPNFTRTLAVADVPAVTVDGIRYREFLLDINQKASASLLSLDAVKLFVSDDPALHGALDGAGNLPGAIKTYDTGAGNWVKLDARLSTGSGSSDMVLDVPEAALAGGQYVYLYSKFGANAAANGGFEEWAVQGPAGGPVQTGGSISGAVYIRGTRAPDGTLIYLYNSDGELVDESVVHNGTYTFNNVLLDGTTPYTVQVPPQSVGGADIVPTSDVIYFPPNTNPFDLYLGNTGG